MAAAADDDDDCRLCSEGSGCALLRCARHGRIADSPNSVSPLLSPSYPSPPPRDTAVTLVRFEETSRLFHPHEGYACLMYCSGFQITTEKRGARCREARFQFRSRAQRHWDTTWYMEVTEGEYTNKSCGENRIVSYPEKRFTQK